MQNSNVEQNYKTLLIIWFALLASQFLFLVVIFFAKPEVYRFDFARPLFGENAVMIVAFAALALANFALSFIMKKRAYQQAVEKQEISYVQTGLVLACAFCESITLLGLVLAFAFAYQYFFLWFALGILGILLHFPRREDVIAASYKK
jgi:F0F1-type ATP synthase membrane subunit c/vacuolar-type H+-ATPase subunit K